MVEYESAKILWDFQIHTIELVMVNQLEIVEVAVPNDSNIKK